MLGLRRGEGEIIGLAVAVAFFSSGGLLIAQSGTDALFFAHSGVRQLPTMYLLLGSGMFVASLGVGAALGRFGHRRAFVGIPVTIGACALAGRVALWSGVSWAYPGLWLLRGASEFLLGLTVWGLAGHVTDTRQAKRFFPLIGAGAVLGQVVGGFATKPLAAAIGAENLVLVWAGTLLAVAVLGFRLMTGGARGSEQRRREKGGAFEEMRQGLRYVRRSSLMRWMSVGAILASVLYFSLYLSFSGSAVQRYPKPDELAGFLGVLYGLATGVTLLLSLLIMNRVLAKVGVPVVMLVLPLLYIVAFGVLLVRSSFLALVAFRFAQVVWLQGGAVAAWEAVTNTVPAERRDQTRAFMYGGPTQVGTVIAGLVALVGEHVVSARAYDLIGLCAAAAALFTMWRVRRAYVAELIRAVREGRPHVFGAAPGGTDPFGLAGADGAGIAVVVDALSDDDRRVRRLAAEMVGEVETALATTALVAALDDEDPEVRSRVATALARTHDPSVAADVSALLADPHPDVRLAAAGAIGLLAEATTRDAWIRPLLGDRDPLVRATAARVLLEGGPDAEAEQVVSALTAAADPETRAAGLRALTAWLGQGSFERAAAGLRDPAPVVRSQASRTVAAIDPTRATPVLVEALADDDVAVRRAVAEALGRIGADARDAVIGSLFVPDRRDGALAALERIRLDEPAPKVQRFAAESVARALDDDRLATSIDAGGDDRLALLRDSLRARSRREALLALRAAAALDRGDALSVALETLSVADPQQRANALEIIDTVGDHGIVRPLMSIWEPGEASGRGGQELDRLLADPDDWIRDCARWAIAQGEGGSMTETMTTVPLMERVVFLRKVPLFADLEPMDLKPIAAIATEHSFADGDTIAEQGESGDEMYAIALGEVAVVAREAEGMDRTLAVRSTGEVIGEMAVITSRPRMASLVARGDVRLLTLARRQFEAIIRERPEISLAVMRVLCDRLATREDQSVP